MTGQIFSIENVELVHLIFTVWQWLKHEVGQNWCHLSHPTKRVSMWSSLFYADDKQSTFTFCSQFQNIIGLTVHIPLLFRNICSFTSITPLFCWYFQAFFCIFSYYIHWHIASNICYICVCAPYMTVFSELYYLL